MGDETVHDKALEDSMRPRRLSGASGRPLNFTVGRTEERMQAADEMVGIMVVLHVGGQQALSAGGGLCVGRPEVVPGA